MVKLNGLDYQKLQFQNTGRVVYDGKIDPMFDSPLTSLYDESGFIISNNRLELTFNNNQYLYNLMVELMNQLYEKTNDSISLPVYITDEKCIITFIYPIERIPVYLTTTDKGSSKCFLNVKTELKEYLVIGLGFKLQFKIHYTGTSIHFILESIQIPDMFNGDKDYLEPIDNEDDKNESTECTYSDDSNENMYASNSDGIEISESNDESVTDDDISIDAKQDNNVNIKINEEPVGKLSQYIKNPAFSKYIAELKELENIDILDKEQIENYAHKN